MLVHRDGHALYKRGEEVVAVRYVFGRFTRAAHWLRVAIMIWLVATGFYIANPFLARDFLTPTSFNFVQTFIRASHVLLGWVLIALTLVRLYEFFFVRRDGRLGVGEELRMARILWDGQAWKEQLAFYLLLRKDPPSYTYSNYGPLQYLTYMFLYAALLGVSATGILLSAPYVPTGLAGAAAALLKPLEVWLGGLAQVRIWHHWFMWAIIIFTALHLYMVVWNSLRTRSLVLESIVSGYKAKKG